VGAMEPADTLTVVYVRDLPCITVAFDTAKAATSRRLRPRHALGGEVAFEGHAGHALVHIGAPGGRVPRCPSPAPATSPPLPRHRRWRSRG